MIRFLVLLFSGLMMLCSTQMAQSSGVTHYCETCGRVCVTFCNTREFRPCCINFIKKRSAPQSILPAHVKGDQDDADTDLSSAVMPPVPWQLRRIFQQKMQPALSPPLYIYNSSPSLAAAANALSDPDA